MDHKGHYFLNSLHNISYPKKFTYAGVFFEYTGANTNVEEVKSTSLRKLRYPLILLILQSRKMPLECENRSPHIITYSYTISENEIQQIRASEREHHYNNHYHHQRRHNQYNEPSFTQQQQVQQLIPDYTWKMSEWSPCDQLCKGKRNRTANCCEINSGQMVQAHLAPKYCSRSVKPIDEFKVCNTDCVLEWDTNKSECSAQCGEGWRQVQATCVQRYIDKKLYKKVDPSYCRQDTKPAIMEKCVGDCNDVTWGYGEWGNVSEEIK